MSEQYQGHPYPPAAVPPAPKPPKVKRFGFLALTVTAATAAIIGGAIGGAGKTSGTTAEPSTVTVTVPAKPSPTKTVTAPAAPAPKDEETKQAPAPSGDQEVSDGIYEVGNEIAAGRYRTEVPNGGAFTLCSYKRMTDDSGDTDSIITIKLANEGEKLSVTVKRGEFFETDGCGTWVKVS